MGGAYEGDTYPNALFLNPGHGNRWITLELRGKKSNRYGIGARIRVRVATKTGERSIHVVVGTGGSFGSSSLRQEIGLGAATRIIDVEIWWPTSGIRQHFKGLEMGRSWLIRELAAEPELLSRPRIDLDRHLPSKSSKDERSKNP